jgi:acetoin utilization deacetylase AcuC-like enzyme
MRFAIVYSPEIKETNLAISRRLIGFERAIKNFNIEYIKPETFEFDERILYEIHSREMIEKVRRFFASSSTFRSAWAVYTAAKLLRDFDFVFVPTSGTGHSAMRDRFKGYSFLNDVNIAIKVLRESGFKKISILDTDTHHGEGVFEYITYDRDSMYFCFCGRTGRSSNGRKICFGFENEEEYLKNIRDALKAMENFSTEVLIWYVGQDAHEGELSDLNLSTECFRKITEQIKEKIERVKTLIILSGGSSEEVTEELTNAILTTLSE